MYCRNLEPMNNVGISFKTNFVNIRFTCPSILLHSLETRGRYKPFCSMLLFVKTTPVNGKHLEDKLRTPFAN